MDVLSGVPCPCTVRVNRLCVQFALWTEVASGNAIVDGCQSILYRFACIARLTCFVTVLDLLRRRVFMQLQQQTKHTSSRHWNWHSSVVKCKLSMHSAAFLTTGSNELCVAKNANFCNSRTWVEFYDCRESYKRWVFRCYSVLFWRLSPCLV